MEDYFIIGKIVNTQGLKGDVRVVPSTFDVKRFELLEKVTIFNEKNEKILTIEKIWYHKNFVIIKFEEINSMTDAETIKNYFIKIPVSMGLPLSDDEYYIKDLIDISVYDENENLLGKLKEVIETGANDVYLVKGEKEILIPAIKKNILNVDIKNKIMIVKLDKEYNL